MELRISSRALSSRANSLSYTALSSSPTLATKHTDDLEEAILRGRPNYAFCERPDYRFTRTVTWVTVYSGDMGDTLTTKGFSALSILHVSWSKNPKS